MAYQAALTNPLFIPATRDIISITQANPAVITTSFDHGYQTNWIIRLLIPSYCGMVILNETFYPIIVLSPNTFSIPIDSSGFDPFVIPTGYYFATSPQAIPIGEAASILSGSFRNVFDRPNL